MIAEKKENPVPVRADTGFEVAGKIDINNIITDTSGIVKYEIACNIDNTRHTRKPAGWTADDVKNERTQKKTTVQELAAAIVRGQTHTPTLVNGNGNDFFISADIWELDYDNSAAELHIVTPEIAVADLADRGIYPLFGYYSFSHTPELPKFRVGGMFSETITDATVYGDAIKTLMSIYPTAISWNEKAQRYDRVCQVDLSCFDACRMFYGTDKGLLPIFQGDKTTNLSDYYGNNPA